MKRALVLVFLAAGGGALALSAACGSFLDGTPDTPTAGDGGGDGSSSEGAAGDARPDGEGPTADGFDARLTPSTLSIVAGDTVGVALDLDVTRPSSEPTSVVSVSFGMITDIIAKPRSTNDPSAAKLTFDITALDAAPPRREIVTVTVSDGTHTVNRALTVLLAHHYRDPSTTELVLTAPATFLIKAWGAGGQAPLSGAGGYAEGSIMLGTGPYAIVVGGTPPGGGAGGDPGGGTASGTAKAGGGYSGVFTGTARKFALAQLIAGGGGGACFSSAGNAGGGGGTTGAMPAEDGVGSPGSGAGVGMGGAAGPGGPAIKGQDGGPLQGGNAGADVSGVILSGGGGGGGYYGGGGGSAPNGGCTAGGGGSSFVIGGAINPLTIGAKGTMAGNDADALRGPAGGKKTAGDVGKDGAVILIPQ